MVVAAADPTDLVQFGVLGIILLLILAGWLWAKPAVDDLKDRLAKTESQRDALIEVYEREVIPALRDATSGAMRSVSAVEGITPVLTEVKTLLLSRPTT